MDPDTTLSICSAVLLMMASASYVRQERIALTFAAALFFPTCALSLILGWWVISPVLAVVFLTLTLGISLLVLCLFAIDVIWAPFGLEMTYLTFLCWLLGPLAVVLSIIGVVL